MISKNDIESIVNDYIGKDDKFLVEVLVSKKNVINVFVDGDSGISINECVNISRQIESRYDRDDEDYELKVSSPGLDRPFKLFRQYKKYIGKEIEVLIKDEKEVTGVLASLTENVLSLEILKGKKKNEKDTLTIPFENILESKAVISFKK